MDNIVIFSKSLDNYLQHFHNVFQELTAMRIILQPNKSYLDYLLVYFFGQKVNAFGMATAEVKLAAII